MREENITRSQNRSIKLDAEKQEWLRTFYSEAWKQYVHEDDLYLSRSTLFLAIQAAFIGIITSTVGPLVISPSKFSILGFGVFGFLACFFSILGLSLLFHWEKMTHAAHDYAIMRNITARIIEQKSGIDIPGPAEIEWEWRSWSDKNKNEISRDQKGDNNYSTGINDKKTGLEIAIPPRRFGGFITHLNTIKLLRFTWYVIYAIGVAILISVLYIK